MNQDEDADIFRDPSPTLSATIERYIEPSFAFA